MTTGGRLPDVPRLAAGLSGTSDDLYRAARIGRDVHAVERTVETDDPAYVGRRSRTRSLVGRPRGSVQNAMERRQAVTRDEYLARQRERIRERRKDPVYRERELAQQRNRYRADPA